MLRVWDGFRGAMNDGVLKRRLNAMRARQALVLAGTLARKARSGLASFPPGIVGLLILSISAGARSDLHLALGGSNKSEPSREYITKRTPSSARFALFSAHSGEREEIMRRNRSIFAHCSVVC
jgi:hypothetical protein